MPMIALAVMGALAIDGPDLSTIDTAVAKCDTKIMTKTFTDEPPRRRAFVIAAFAEQQEIVKARRALAEKRMALTQQGQTVQVTADQREGIEREGQALAERQRELDDVRMLNGLREDALDLMRKQYITTCSGGRVRVSE